MNVAIIFAGGVGQRMNAGATPKQFLELHGRPIMIHTLELFDSHPEIDGIVIACVAEWIEHLKGLLERFRINKVVDIVPGGKTGQMSIFNALEAAEAKFPRDSVVLIHDGVRPLIKQETVTANIAKVNACGSAITTAPTVETFVVVDEDMAVQEVPERAKSRLAKAPQSFVLSDIIDVHRWAQNDNVLDTIDSCTLMNTYGKEVTLVEGPTQNIKITTPIDYFIFKAVVEAEENLQIYGIRQNGYE
jgi:2-C-methyl-D-erythritol 4-phosphate cytidylyltransferase